MHSQSTTTASSSNNNNAGLEEKKKATPFRISQEERRQIIQNLVEKKSTSNSDELLHFMGSGYSDKLNKSTTLQNYVEVDDSRYDNRQLRVIKTEEAIRQEIYKEFTFQPVIKKLPNAYGVPKDRDTPFYIRASKWQKAVTNEIKKKRVEKEKGALGGCTFHPKMNKNSELAIQEIQLNDISMSSVSVSERLYNKGMLASIEKEKCAREEMARESENISKECTFKPKRMTEKTKPWNRVQSKYQSSQHRTDENDKSSANLTFTPKIKGVGSHMSSAKLYIDTNIIDRLTRPVSANGGMDSSFSRNTSFSVHGESNVSFKSLKLGRSQSASALDRSNATMSAEEKKTRKLNFEKFLSRQNQGSLRTERNIGNLRLSMTPDFKPSVSQSFHTIRKNDTNFLTRCERDMIKRVDSAARLQANFEHENTFKPHVNLKSHELRSRSANELSRGDVLKSIANHRIMKIRNEQEEMSELTFKPEITKTAKKLNKSFLKLNENPANALALHSEIINKRQKEHEAHLKVKEEKEMQQCSFTPKIINCPDYVKRIAKSMALVRETRRLEIDKKALKSAKKEWK